MRADDDGFVASPKRACGASEKNLELLASNGYVIRFKSGVIVLTDWKVNNTLKNDRYRQTSFQEELSVLNKSPLNRYIPSSSELILEPDRNQSGTILEPDWKQTGSNLEPERNHLGTTLEPQYRIDKDSIERSSKKDAATAAPDPRTDADLATIIQHFQEAIGDFPRSALDKLQRWREVYPTELICKAIDEAAENGKRSWAYTEGILKSWQADGVRTLGDVEARRESRKKPGTFPAKEWKDFT